MNAVLQWQHAVTAGGLCVNLQELLHCLVSKPEGEIAAETIVLPKSCRHFRRNAPCRLSLQISCVFIFFMALHDKKAPFIIQCHIKPRLQKNIKIQIGRLWCHFCYDHIRRGLFGVTGISISYGKECMLKMVKVQTHSVTSITQSAMLQYATYSLCSKPGCPLEEI